MKIQFLIFLLVLIGNICNAQVSVRGYYRKDGTYVQPHQRTYPNNTITDNYSYHGNYNPNKGIVTGGSNYNTSSDIVTRDQIYSNKRMLREMANDDFKKETPYSATRPTSKYISNRDRTYFKDSSGNYFQVVKNASNYDTLLVYNSKNEFILKIHYYKNGDIYVYDTNGGFVKYIPRR